MAQMKLIYDYWAEDLLKDLSYSMITIISRIFIQFSKYHCKSSIKKYTSCLAFFYFELKLKPLITGIIDWAQFISQVNETFKYYKH